MIICIALSKENASNIGFFFIFPNTSRMTISWVKKKWSFSVKIKTRLLHAKLQIYSWRTGGYSTNRERCLGPDSLIFDSHATLRP
jgi:hypothetical protein